MIKYFFVGGISALIDISLFAFFAKYLGFNYLIVGFSTFMIATFFNYFLGIIFVFESGVKYKKTVEILLVFFVSFIGVIINLSSLYFFVEFIKVDILLGKILATSNTFFWNYFTRKKFIF